MFWYILWVFHFAGQSAANETTSEDDSEDDGSEDNDCGSRFFDKGKITLEIRDSMIKLIGVSVLSVVSDNGNFAHNVVFYTPVYRIRTILK